MISSFFLKEIIYEDKGFMHSLADSFLAPTRQLFSGYTFEIFKNGEVKTTEIHTNFGLRTCFDIACLIPGLVLGIIIKTISLLSDRVLDVHLIAALVHSKHRKHRDGIVSNDRLTLLFTGSQAGCRGNINFDTAKRAHEILRKNPPIGIVFKEIADKNCWNGGTCAAMSWDFIHEFLSRKEQGLNTRAAVQVTGSLSKYQRSNIEFRSNQAALSTFGFNEEIVSESIGYDFNLKKMEAFAKLYNRTVDFASADIDFSQVISEVQNSANMDSVKSVFEQEKNNLSEGVYIININKPQTNHPKRQNKGHQVVYIKGQGEEYFYDPNTGTDEASTDPNGFSLFKGIMHSINMFKDTNVRFFRIC
jgi:hypothetical protein